MATLKELRLARGLTQSELAQKAGLSHPAVNRMENGHPVLATSLRLVARALGVEEEEIEGVEIADRVKREA